MGGGRRFRTELVAHSDPSLSRIQRRNDEQRTKGISINGVLINRYNGDLTVHVRKTLDDAKILN